MLMSFPAALTMWSKPFARGVDAIGTATPLGALKEFLKTGPGQDAISGASMHFFTRAGSMTVHAENFSDYLTMIKELFLGTYAGCIGETSVILILVGAAYLLITKTIDWRAPAGMLGAALIMAFICGEDPLMTLLSGGLCFGAFFMATDYTSAPLTNAGKLIFGAGCGVITLLIRRFGNYPEGVMYSILIMNMVTPFLNRIIPKKFGFVPQVKK
jgi:electron transport complex protein RnfD